ncbi:MAG: hypothetical protein H0V88_14975 [Pyrinomonadaceae bacterium]|nr:hypothetical protein [Pyrinomonadaceae bacterium]
MKVLRGFLKLGFAVLMLVAMNELATAQVRRAAQNAEFGPVVQAYLGYLKAEQEVVDDRGSRREISSTYYRRNLNRIRALRSSAIRIARETGNDYLPELEAVTRDEFKNIFDPLPKTENLRAGAVINNTFRFLSTVRAGEIFFVFARLDVYEQAELMKQNDGRAEASTTNLRSSSAQTNNSPSEETIRPRRARTP